MVLNQLKGRLKTARRGHKLLKDKRDELMRQFMDVVKLNKQLRIRVEEGLTQAFASLQVASAIMSPEMLEQALLYPRQSVELGMTFKNIMSVNVPRYSFHTKYSCHLLHDFRATNRAKNIVEIVGFNTCFC